MKIQKTTWGQIQWLNDDDLPPSNHAMSIGIATINPHVTQQSHIHYQNEQFIYIIEGAGIDVINGEEHPFEAGMFYYIPPNVTHQLINTGSAPVKHILVTVYTAKHGARSYELPDIEQFSGYLYAAVEAIRGQIEGASSPPVAIFDDMGNLVLQTGKYPAYCVQHCHPEHNIDKCPCFQATSTEDGISPFTVCPYGISVFQHTIQYKDHLLGHIVSGHILLSGTGSNREIDMYDTPAGTMLAIQKWTENIVESILSFCSFNALRNSLDLKDSVIAQNQQSRQNLEDSLKAMQNTVTNLRINRHFLFNTLNAIAAQALSGDKSATYQSIVDLAKMFRYTTSVELKIVPLRKELEYLRTYLHMQQLRYGSSLVTELVCPEDVLDGLVPFNLLQPFVENAFTHGFADLPGTKRLRLQFIQDHGRLSITITNNGVAIDQITISRVLEGMGNDSGHGLSLTYSKLKNAYGNDFSICMTSDSAAGTSINISIPLMKQGNDREGIL